MQKTLKRRTVEVTAGIAAVVIAGWQQVQIGIIQRFEIISTEFVLVVERVEVLLQAFFGGFAGINGTIDYGTDMEWSPLQLKCGFDGRQRKSITRTQTGGGFA